MANAKRLAKEIIMALTAEEIKKAELERMRQKYAVGDARSDFLKEREQARTNQWHENNRNARMDRLEGMLTTERGRYSPKTIEDAKSQLDYLRGGDAKGLREHEKVMADKTGDWAVKKEETHAIGLRGQGAEAAGINAEAKNNETLARYGYFDDIGEYHPGSDVSVAEKTGLTKFEQQMLRNQNSLDVQNLRNQGSLATQTLRNQGSSDTAAVNADAKKSAAEIAASSKVEAANIAAKSASQSDIAKAEVERQKNEQKRMADAMQYAAVTGKDLKTALAEIDALKPNTPDAQKPEPQKVDITQKYKEGDVMMTKQGKAVYKIDPTTGKPKWIVESR